MNTAPTYNGNRLRFIGAANIEVTIDNIQIIADDLSQTTTFGVNNANELTSVTDYNGVTSIAYDAWGRTSSKTRGSDSITYEWAKGNFLTEVDATNWGPIGETVRYDYRGDGRRLNRLAGGVQTQYRYAGWSVTNEATFIGFGGGLSKTYVPGLAEIPGNSPTTDDYAYYTHDHLGSTRGLYDPSKNLLGDYEFTPFGIPYHFNTAEDITMLFTGHQHDAVTGAYFAPFRFLDPSVGRWMKRDPMAMYGGTNPYWYAANNPSHYVDPDGQLPIFVPLVVFGIGAAIGAYVGYKNARGPALNKATGALAGFTFGGLTAVTAPHSAFAACICAMGGGAVAYALSDPDEPSLSGFAWAMGTAGLQTYGPAKMLGGSTSCVSGAAQSTGASAGFTLFNDFLDDMHDGSYDGIGILNDIH